MRSTGFSIFAVTMSLAMTGALAETQDLQPRVPLPKASLESPPALPHRLVVKFRDAVRARAHDGALGTVDPAHEVALRDLAVTVPQATFRPLLMLPPERIQRLESRASERSGVAQPDLAGMMIVTCPSDQIEQVAAVLHASDLSEFVYYERLMVPPPCDDLAPTTPHYFPGLQTYHDGVAGIGMDRAWELGRARGEGVVVADCEYGVVLDHEDLCNIIPEPGQTVDPAVVILTWDEHGTAVMGEIMSLDNGYGCTGLAPESQGMFFPEWTVEESFRRATAIANAIAAVDAGDIVLLEMQTTGTNGQLGPAELDPAVWTIVRNGADAGVIVVGAAGNGDADLDSAPFDEYRNRGDSGAIIVGAGSADTAHNKLAFSTYGSRVNVQGWGESVFSLGYGDYAQHGGDKNQRYTSFFSGTSSASPFVAASCASLQSLAEQHRRDRLSPLELRDLLIATGTPQGSGGHIGPIPNMLRAAHAVIRAGGSIDLAVTRVVPDQPVRFTVTHGPPAQTHYVIGSIDGIGSTDVPALGITLGITRPSLITTMQTDAFGDGAAIAQAKGVRSGQIVWIQVCTVGDTSNVVNRRVE